MKLKINLPSSEEAFDAIATISQENYPEAFRRKYDRVDMTTAMAAGFVTGVALTLLVFWSLYLIYV